MEFYKHHVPFVTEWLAPALYCLFSTFMPTDVLASLQDTSVCEATNVPEMISEMLMASVSGQHGNGSFLQV